MAQVVLNWSCELGEVTEVITAHAGSRIIEYEVSVKTAAPLDYVTVDLEARGYGSSAVVMPDGRRLSGLPTVQSYRSAPCGVAGFDPEGGETLGLLTSPAAEGTVGVYLSNKLEGTGNNACGAQYYSPYLGHEPVGTEVRFTVGLLIGGGRDVLAELGGKVGGQFVLRSVTGPMSTTLR